MKTVWQARQWAQTVLSDAGISNAQNESLWLLQHVLGACLWADQQHQLSQDQQNFYAQLVRQRAQHVPLAYILQSQEFAGFIFKVNPSVLVPRADTEVLLQQTLSLLRLSAVASPTVLDIGTGSGILPVSLALLHGQVDLWAWDISPAALQVARANADSHGVAHRIQWCQQDVLSDFAQDKKFDIVISNPPYIASDVIAQLALDVQQEPHLALDGGADGLKIIKAIVQKSNFILHADAWLCLEVGSGQAADVRFLMQQNGFVNVTSALDGQKIERVVIGQKKYG